MAEYIEREALMRRIKEIHCAECDSYHGVRCRACWVDDTLDYIDSEPAADVEPVKRGRWIYNIESGEYVCSACGENALSFRKDTLYGGDLYETCLTDYCPNCGADMRGINDE